jgi:hypothetical protein
LKGLRSVPRFRGGLFKPNRLHEPFKDLRRGNLPFRQMRIERARNDFLGFGQFCFREFLGYRPRPAFGQERRSTDFIVPLGYCQLTSIAFFEFQT